MNQRLLIDSQVSDPLLRESTTHNQNLQLQGECKIISVKLIRFDWLKTVLFIIPITLSIIGLVLIRSYKRLRMKVFFSNSNWSKATHVYAVSNDKVDSICKFEAEIGKDPNRRIFYFQKLKYQIYEDGRVCPIGFSYLSEEVYKQYFSIESLSQGLSSGLIQQNQGRYGLNKHEVQVPYYHQYMFDTLTQPIFLLQYMLIIVGILENLIAFSIIMFAATMFTSTLNYILLYISYRKIRSMAQNIRMVIVLRNGQKVRISSQQLVPGDLFQPKGQLTCDGVVIKGDLFVSQANLTGQNIPILKQPVPSHKEIKKQQHWVYQGSKVIQTRKSALVMAIHTGYTTRRGRIIRKIIYKVTKNPDFYIKAVLMMVESFIFALVLYFAMLKITLQKDIPTIFFFYRFFDIFQYSIPAAIPIYFNLVYSFALARLRWKNISGTDLQKTVEASRLKTMCFDKTGTLTENEIQVYKTIIFINDKDSTDLTTHKHNKNNQFIIKLFAACHAVRVVDGQLQGDEVDVRMFQFSQYRILQSSDSDKVVFSVGNQKEKQRLDVLKVNQFQSAFQSMSVLIRDCNTNKYFVFVKGAPEKIEHNSVLKIKDYETTITELSMGGYRTIACGYKEIDSEEVTNYLNNPRQAFQEQITILGLVAFQNKLKQFTYDTISRLRDSNIEAKIITGDNIYIAIETAIRSGIIQSDQKVVLLQGRKQSRADMQGSSNRVLNGTVLWREGDRVYKQKVKLDQKGDYEGQRRTMAIDNDFLMISPSIKLSDSIKVFSRISPENKAKIVRTYKQQYISQFQNRSWSGKVFGCSRSNVGMTGDGANDLIAIREADVGIGMSKCDASYSASFTVQQISDILQVVRDSKCTESNISEVFFYYVSASVMKNAAVYLLITDTAYYSDFQILFNNFAISILIGCLLSMSPPSNIDSKYSPSTNFQNLFSHLRLWGNVFIPCAGLIIVFLYYQQTPEYRSNPHPVVTVQKGYPYSAHSVTILWMSDILPYTLNGLFLYSRGPWKKRIWSNVPLSVVILIDTTIGIALFFNTDSSIGQFFNLIPVSIKEAGIVLGIMSGFLIVQFLFNVLLESSGWHKVQRVKSD